MKILDRKPTRLFYIVIILILLLAQPIYYKTHNKVSAYKINRVTNDLSLAIENLNIVSINGGIYIEPGWKLRTGSSNKDTITDISLTLSIDKKTFFPINFGANVNTPNKIIYEESSPFFISKVKIKDTSALNLKINYSLNGDSIEYSEDLELKSFTTQLTQVNGKLIQYYSNYCDTRK